MKTVLNMPNADVITTTPSSEVRKAALGRAVAGLTAQGRRVAKPDYQAVLVGHNDYRAVLVRRQWRIREVYELVEVDEQGNISIREV
jgi:hypothetical protein